jgi:hypothetical protein
MLSRGTRTALQKTTITAALLRTCNVSQSNQTGGKHALGLRSNATGLAFAGSHSRFPLRRM